jgi:beta-lactamase class A
VPKTWQVGDKTGSGSNGTSNDVAVVWPQNGAPLIVSAYLTGATVDSDQRNSVLAEVGRVAAQTFR